MNYWRSDMQEPTVEDLMLIETAEEFLEEESPAHYFGERDFIQDSYEGGMKFIRRIRGTRIA